MTDQSHWAGITKAHRIVLKVGTSTLTRDGRLRPDKFTGLARDVACLMKAGKEVVIVSSGAIAVGAHAFKAGIAPRVAAKLAVPGGLWPPPLNVYALVASEVPRCCCLWIGEDPRGEGAHPFYSASAVV